MRSLTTKLVSIRPDGVCAGCGGVYGGGAVAGGGLGDTEDRDDGVGSGDLDFGDQGFDERFAGLITAGGDECGDVIGDVGQGGGVGELVRYITAK
ncbi:hypothetical protein ABIA39_003362 [Nocardia sp. GAS34]|uniref:hypothetical protein n=1 Tax=unclassified Nocardia TaxID=2637762 RepID=UPI003D2132ED